MTNPTHVIPGRAIQLERGTRRPLDERLAENRRVRRGDPLARGSTARPRTARKTGDAQARTSIIRDRVELHPHTVGRPFTAEYDRAPGRERRRIGRWPTDRATRCISGRRAGPITLSIPIRTTRDRENRGFHHGQHNCESREHRSNHTSSPPAGARSGRPSTAPRRLRHDASLLLPRKEELRGLVTLAAQERHSAGAAATSDFALISPPLVRLKPPDESEHQLRWQPVGLV